jgi:hypothetical protein
MKNFFFQALIVMLLFFLFSFDGFDNNYFVTASMSEDGVTAGMQILRGGGTAMDAALSVALSEIAETSGKHVSYAGLLNLVYFEAEFLPEELLKRA